MPLEYKLNPGKYNKKKMQHHIFTLLWRLLGIKSPVTPGRNRLTKRKHQGQTKGAFPTYFNKELLSKCEHSEKALRVLLPFSKV